MRRGRRKVDNPATARRILAAAEQQFAARGMAGARTEEIATAAHANKAMLYYYFGDKRRLHRAVLENLLRQLRASVESQSGVGTASQRLERIVSSYFDFLAGHPNYPRLMHREAIGATGNFDWIMQEYLRPFLGVIVSTIKDGMASGEFRPADPLQTAFMITGMTTHYFAAAPFLSRIAGKNLLAPAMVKQRKRALLDFLSHGLKRTGARAR